MKHITSFDLAKVIAGLRHERDHLANMIHLLPDQRDFYQREYDRTEELLAFFENALDRVYKSRTLSTRISVKL